MENNNQKITFVAVVAGKFDIDNFCDITLMSLVKNFKNEDIFEIIIITRDVDINYFNKIILNYNTKNIKIKIVNELDIFNKRKYRGYQLQQILKLYVSYIVNTKWYMTLDSDMYLTQKICINNIIINNNPIVNIEISGFHYDWHEKSGAILNCPVNKNIECTGVTPQILYTNIVIELLNNYETNILKSPDGWTEYSLYSLFITEIKKISLNDIYCKRNLYDTCIWGLAYTADKDKNLKFYLNNIDRQFSDNETYFSLVQSTLFKKDKNLYKKLYKHIKKKLSM